MTGKQRHIALILLLTAGAAVRLWFMLRVPMLDNDSAGLLLAANNLVQYRLLTPISPLPTLIVAGLIALLGVDVLWARLPELLASIGSLWLVYALTAKVGTRRAALYAVALLAPPG